MTTIRTKKHTCGNCGYVFDAQTSAFGDHTPKKGDLTICLKCTAVSVFRTNLTPTLMTEDEWESLKVKHPDVVEELRQAKQAIFDTLQDKPLNSLFQS